jgi:hypothetical protein
MELFRNHVYLADSASDYPRLIEQALHENKEEQRDQRIAFAKTHTWENCMKSLYLSACKTNTKN